MSDYAIGVFDSGLGGLTAIRELKKVLPNENIIYFGDTGRVPYGTKGKKTILKYAMQDISFLLSKKIKFIIAACGTVSSLLDKLVGKVSIPIIGVVKPTALAAAKCSKHKKIGIIGTNATISSKSYVKELLQIDSSLMVYEQACALFAPMIESGFVGADDPIVIEAVKRYVLPLKYAGIDTLILGCTHYPVISEAIKRVIGDDVHLINSGKETAIFAKNMLTDQGLLRHSNNVSQYKYFISDEPQMFSQIAEIFLGEKIDDKVEKIDIENY